MLLRLNGVMGHFLLKHSCVQPRCFVVLCLLPLDLSCLFFVGVVECSCGLGGTGTYALLLRARWFAWRLPMSLPERLRVGSWRPSIESVGYFPVIVLFQAALTVREQTWRRLSMVRRLLTRVLLPLFILVDICSLCIFECCTAAVPSLLSVLP